MLITFILLGKYLEASAKGKTTESISRLLALQPATGRPFPAPPGRRGSPDPPSPHPHPTAALKCDCFLDVDVPPHEVEASSLARGDVIKVLPGQQIVLDGLVLRGRSEVNESMLTGEATPVPKCERDAVTGGTINHTGVLWVIVTAELGEGTLSQIMQVPRYARDAPETHTPEMHPR